MKEYIETTVNKIIEKYGTRNPMEILKQMGITVEFNSNLNNLKGFFTVIFGQKYIIINGNLPQNEQQEVAAHELGHSIIHSHIAESESYREFMICDMESKPEYEANLFAAYLLINDEELKYAATLGYSENQMAAYLGISEKLLKLRLCDF